MVLFFSSSADRRQFTPSRFSSARDSAKLRRAVPGGGRTDGSRRRRHGSAGAKAGRPVRGTASIEARGAAAADLHRHRRKSVERRPQQAGHREGRAQPVARDPAPKRALASKDGACGPQDKRAETRRGLHPAPSPKTKNIEFQTSERTRRLRIQGLQSIGISLQDDRI